MQHVSNCVASTSQASQPLHEIYRYGNKKRDDEETELTP